MVMGGSGRDTGNGESGFLTQTSQGETIETKVKSEEGGVHGGMWPGKGAEKCSSVLVATWSDPVLRICWSIETVESPVLHPSPKGHPDTRGFLVFWEKPPPPWEPGTVCLVPFVSPNHVVWRRACPSLLLFMRTFLEVPNQ